MKQTSRTRIVGIGSDFGDDRVGWIVADRLAVQLPEYDVRRLRSPLDLFECTGDVERLHIIDACRGAGPPGAIFRRAWPFDGLAVDRGRGTHDCDLPSALQLLSRLSPLPAEVILWAVEASPVETRPAWRTPQSPLSPPVAAAVDGLVERIVAEFNDSSLHFMGAADHA